MRARTQVPIRVLQVSAGLDPVSGGPTTSAIATAVALRHCGLMNAFAYVEGPSREGAAQAAGLVASGIETYGFPVTMAAGKPGVRWGVSLRFALWLLRNVHRFDVVHTHGAWTFTSVVGLAAARLRHRVAVLTCHESLTDFDRQKSGPLHSQLKRLLRWVLVRRFDVVVVASSLEHADMGEGARVRSVVIPHALVEAVSEYHSASNGPRGLRVGFLGRLHPKKNVEVLIDALALLPTDVRLHIAGDGPAQYRDLLESRAQKRGVGGRIQWLGFVDEPGKREFFDNVDVLAMPSEFECFGLAAAEALRAGVPVVASSRVGIADVIRDYQCGYIVTARAAEVARAVLEVIDERRCAELGRNARRAASEAFSMRAHGMRLVAEYEAALLRLNRSHEVCR